MPRRCLHGVHPVSHAEYSKALDFASALPARGASVDGRLCKAQQQLCLGAACTGCIASARLCLVTSATLPRRCLHGVHRCVRTIGCTGLIFASALPARGASTRRCLLAFTMPSLPRRCLHGVHPSGRLCLVISASFASALPARGASRWQAAQRMGVSLCLGAACTGCIIDSRTLRTHYIFASALPARGASNHVRPVQFMALLCLGAACTGCILLRISTTEATDAFASALPARGASRPQNQMIWVQGLCLGAACTGCIGKSRQIAAHHFVAYAVSR